MYLSDEIGGSPRLSKWARWALFWTLFIGIGALVGTVMFWLFPTQTGLIELLPLLRQLPLPAFFFDTGFWPGLALLLVNGITQLVTAALIWRRHPLAPVFALVCGLILLAWILVQFVIFPANPVSIIYFIFGLVQSLMAYLWLRHRRQSTNDNATD